MAANIKQRLVKPGRDFNYAEGVKVLNATGSQINADTIVRAVGLDGPFIKVSAIFPSGKGTTKEAAGRLMILKHDLPANGYGVALPWKLVVTALDFSAKVVGDRVFGSTNGAIDITSGGTKARVVGYIVDNSATAGAYLFSGEISDQAAP